MNSILLAGITPHPPIIIPEVGGRETEKVKNTIEALTTLAEEVKECGPETVVIITPHGTVFRNAIAVNGQDQLSGSLEQFGAPQVKIQVSNDPDLVDTIIREAETEGILGVELDQEQAINYDISLNLDHGSLVPMYFLQKAQVEASYVHVTIGFLSCPEIYSFGKSIQRAAQKEGRKIVVLASGDLSHCLIPGAPAQYNPAGKEFDSKMKTLLQEYNVEKIMNLDESLVSSAAECGLRPIIMALGSLDGYRVESQVLSYEGPFGVGYLVALLRPGKFNEEDEAGERYRREEQQKIKAQQEKESIYVKLAREALETYIREGKKPELPDPLPEELRDKAGVFVSIKSKGQLRGCIGTIEPTRDNIAEEITQNALSAGLSDLRFPPVTSEELPYLNYSVDLLMPPEPVEGLQNLDPQKFGVIVKSGLKTGLLLPKLEGVDTVEKQVNIAREKAGLNPGEKADLYRFEVKRYY